MSSHHAGTRPDPYAIPDDLVELVDLLDGAYPLLVEAATPDGTPFEVRHADPLDPLATINFGENGVAAEFYIEALRYLRHRAGVDPHMEAASALPVRHAEPGTVESFLGGAHVLCIEGAADPDRQVTVFADPFASRPFGVARDGDLSGPPWNLLGVVVPYLENLEDPGLITDICHAAGMWPSPNATLHRRAPDGTPGGLVATIGSPANPHAAAAPAPEGAPA